MEVSGFKLKIDAKSSILGKRRPPRHQEEGVLNPVQCHLIKLWVNAAQYAAFLPKEICSHADGWHILDMNLAVCRSCQSVHACSHAHCHCTLNDEGFNICIVTGCCIRELSNSVGEYMDTTVGPCEVKERLVYGHKLGQSTEMIHVYCLEFLDGILWNNCMEIEAEKIGNRRNTCFIR
jgi:hypothetical protein